MMSSNNVSSNSVSGTPSPSSPLVYEAPSAITTTPLPPPKPSRFQQIWQAIRNVVSRNSGIFILLLAQFFASVMALTTRYLATSLPNHRKFHALQILFVRMGITVAFSLAWMWYKHIPHAPFGPQEVRGLLLARGVSGFIGVFGLYYSLSYLPLPDATSITFLVPTVVSFTCSILPSLREPFTLPEKLAGLVSLIGVALIARPTFLFPPEAATGAGDTVVNPAQRSLAVTVALVGILGAASAYTLIRLIGTRAHPLLSVTYFSGITTISSLIGLLLIPSVGGIILPETWIEWTLLFFIGISGFVMQWLLTLGLQMEKAGRAGMMVYTQLVFSLVFEWLVWGDIPVTLSLVGCTLIVGSAVVVNVWKSKEVDAKGKAVAKVVDEDDEERPLLDSEDEEYFGTRKV